MDDRKDRPTQPRPRERQAIALALPAMLVIAGAAIWAIVAAVQWVLS